MSETMGAITVHEGDPSRRALIVAPSSYPPSAPLFWYVDRLLVFEGWTVGQVSVGSDEAADLRDAAARFLNAPPSLLVTKSETSLFGIGLPGVPGIWLTPQLSDARLVEHLSAATSMGLLIGSVGDPTWNVEAAARLRGMEILQLTGVDHDLEVPGDPVGTLAVLGRVVGRCQAMIRRLARV